MSGERFRGENSRSGRLDALTAAFEVARVRSGRMELVLTDDNERVVTSPATKHGRGQSTRGGDGIGDGSAVNRSPMSRSDARQGCAAVTPILLRRRRQGLSLRSSRVSRAKNCACLGLHLHRGDFSSHSFPAPSDRTPARQGAPNISSRMAVPGSFWRWAILAAPAFGRLDWPGGRQRGIRDLAELHSRALAEPVRRSGEHGGLTLGTAVGVILTAALAWDRADGLLNAVAAPRFSLPCGSAAGMTQGTTDLTGSDADRRLSSSVNAGFGRERPDRRKKRQFCLAVWE